MDRIRLLVQLLVAAVSNGYYVGFASGKIFQGSSKAFCVPGLNCYSCPGALGACPIGALQAVANTRNFTIPFYVLGTLMIFGALLGRVVCGWLCPFGLIQDLLHKIPFPRKIKTFKWDKGLRYVKYGILLFLVILLPMFVVNDYGQGVPWFCEYLCPSGTLMAGWPLTIANEGLRGAIGWIFAWKSLILILLIFLSILIYRPFCRYLCPLGAIYGGCNKISLYRYRIDETKCVSCGSCKAACKMEIDVVKTPNSGECIRCGKCISACPEGAINGRAKK